MLAVDVDNLNDRSVVADNVAPTALISAADAIEQPDTVASRQPQRVCLAVLVSGIDLADVPGAKLAGFPPPLTDSLTNRSAVSVRRDGYADGVVGIVFIGLGSLPPKVNGCLDRIRVAAGNDPQRAVLVLAAQRF